MHTNTRRYTLLLFFIAITGNTSRGNGSEKEMAALLCERNSLHKKNSDFSLYMADELTRVDEQIGHADTCYAKLMNHFLYHNDDSVPSFFDNGCNAKDKACFMAILDTKDTAALYQAKPAELFTKTICFQHKLGQYANALKAKSNEIQTKYNQTDQRIKQLNTSGSSNVLSLAQKAAQTYNLDAKSSMISKKHKKISFPDYIKNKLQHMHAYVRSKVIK